jgi:hypothetical protein
MRTDESIDRLAPLHWTQHSPVRDCLNCSLHAGATTLNWRDYGVWLRRQVCRPDLPARRHSWTLQLTERFQLWDGYCIFGAPTLVKNYRHGC